MQPPRQLLVTTALLYANGPLHLGHLLEQIQADIWVRFQRLKGNHCYFIGGEDAHGTPIMLAAEAQNISTEALIQSVFFEHQRDLSAFNISFDHFGTTHCAENEELVRFIYHRLSAKGNITVRMVEQAYDPKRQLFLPDRYVKGTCPHCGTLDQYGDNCEQCGATYQALELKDPISVISGATPVPKLSEQYFLKLSDYYDFLKSWIQQNKLPPATLHKLLEWFTHANSLNDLAISREAPYFGFRIPETKDKYFYVWIDAPVGYMAIFKQLCEKHPSLQFNAYWENTAKTELYHIIGKDIVQFHTVFWPVMLKGSSFRLPTRLFVHGYLTIDGRKMSKSRGTFITAQQYLRHLPPEYLRYYLASKLNDTPEDINLSWLDFTQKINADCIGKFINIASRCAKLLSTYCDNQMSYQLENSDLFDYFVNSGKKIESYFECQKYSQAIRLIMELSDKANHYLAQKQPWILAKNKVHLEQMQQICTTGLNLFRILSTYLKPVLPHVTDQIAYFLQLRELTWKGREVPLLGHQIRTYQPLLARVNSNQIESLLEDTFK